MTEKKESARNDRKKGKESAMTSACCHCEPKAKQSRLLNYEIATVAKNKGAPSQ